MGIKLGENILQNTLNILFDFIVPKSQYFVFVPCQPLITHCISFVGGVLTAVDFKHETHFAAKKVHNVWADWLLSNKFVAIESTGPEMFPHTLFGLRRIVP